MVSDCYKPVINGVVTSIACLAEALERLGHEVHLFVPGHPHQKDAGTSIHRFASAAFWLHKEERIAAPWPPASVRAYLEEPFEVVHLHTPFGLGLLGWLGARRRRLPTIFTHHTLWEEYVHYLRLPPAWTRPGAIAICNWFCNASSRVVAPSAEVRSRLLSQGVGRPIDVIPTGIDSYLFEGGSEQRARADLAVTGQEHLFVYIGRLAREKSIDFVLEAFARMLERNAGCRLALIGDGPARGELETQAANLGVTAQVSFLGFLPRERLRDYLAAARGFLFASQTETQGLVLLEAQAASVPVVAVRASGTSEAVDHDRTGVLVAPGDREAFVGAALRLAVDDEFHATLSRQARTWAQAFSSEAMAHRMVETYREAQCAKAYNNEL